MGCKYRIDRQGVQATPSGGYFWHIWCRLFDDRCREKRPDLKPCRLGEFYMGLEEEKPYTSITNQIKKGMRSDVKKEWRKRKRGSRKMFSKPMENNVMKIFSKELDIKSFVLERDDNKSELALLEQFDAYLKQNRPYGVVGFAFRGYDIPLLAIKRHHIGPRFWAIRDLVRRTPAIDILESARDYLSRLKGRSVSYRELDLDSVCEESCFKHLKFENVKALINCEDCSLSPLSSEF